MRSADIFGGPPGAADFQGFVFEIVGARGVGSGGEIENTETLTHYLVELSGLRWPLSLEMSYKIVCFLTMSHELKWYGT